MLADRDASALAALAASAGNTARPAIEASGPPALPRAAAEEVATLAESLERGGARAYWGEAHCAWVLAGAAASIAQSIIVMNLALVRALG